MPYLDTEEVCEDVEFQECVDAEVQVRQTEQCNGSVNVNVISLLLHRYSLRKLTAVLVMFPTQVPIKVCREVDPNRDTIVNREIAGTAVKKKKKSSGSRSRGSGGSL